MTNAVRVRKQYDAHHVAEILADRARCGVYTSAMRFHVLRRGDPESRWIGCPGAQEVTMPDA